MPGRVSSTGEAVVLPDKPHMAVKVEYGEYTFDFTVDPQRQMSHISVTSLTASGQQSTLINRMVARNAATRGIDFHLAGIEVFAQQAVKELLQSLGEVVDKPK